MEISDEQCEVQTNNVRRLIFTILIAIVVAWVLCRSWVSRWSLALGWISSISTWVKKKTKRNLADYKSRLHNVPYTYRTW